jgi:2,3-diketo-5-methylthio-1-phosphopentane phosphatase
MSPAAACRLAVLCDFDGTIVPCDTVELMYQRFAEPPCPDLNEKWIRGEISTQEELQGCFATITASRAEMEAALCAVSIDPAFPPFLAFCRERGYRFAVVSDGLDWIIDLILGRHGLDGLTVYCNRLRFEPGGFRFTFPFFDPESPLRGISKPTIIRRHREEGFRVAFIGDGLSDLDAVPVADVVYAKERLLEYCRDRGIAATEFTDFGDLMEKWVEP